MIFRRKLELELAEVKPDVDMVRNAAAELKASSRFKRVLRVRVSLFHVVRLS